MKYKQPLRVTIISIRIRGFIVSHIRTNTLKISGNKMIKVECLIRVKAMRNKMRANQMVLKID